MGTKVIDLKNFFVCIYKTFFFFDVAVIILHFLPVLTKGSAARIAFFTEGRSLLVLAILTLIFYLLAERRQLPFFPWKPKWRSLLAGFACGALPLLLTCAILKVLHRLSFGTRQSFGQIFLWMAALLLNATVTELLLHGYLFRLYRKFCNFAVTAILLSVLYLSLHATLFSESRICLLNGLLFNLLLCLLVEYTGSLYPSILAGFSYRLAGSLLLGTIDFVGNPTLFSIILSGKAWLSGGSDGLEGSAVLLLLNALLCGYFIVKLLKRNPIKIPPRFLKWLPRRLSR